MRQTLVFVKKEWLESLRTYRVVLLFVVFLVFGMLSPFLAKMTPRLLEFLLPEMGSDLSTGLTRSLLQSLPKPTAVDAWLQYFKNMSQMGLILVIIVFAGLLADEYQRNTLPMLLTKGLRSSSIVFGKFLASVALLSAAYLAGFAVCLLYTWIYFTAGATWPVVAGALGLLLSYWLLLALFLFWGAVLSKVSMVLLGVLSSLGFLYLLNLHHAAAVLNPISLIGVGAALTAGAAKVSDFKGAFLITPALILVMLAASVGILRRREI